MGSSICFSRVWLVSQFEPEVLYEGKRSSLFEEVVDKSRVSKVCPFRIMPTAWFVFAGKWSALTPTLANLCARNRDENVIFVKD
jgi:hypothetical protein